MLPVLKILPRVLISPLTLPARVQVVPTTQGIFYFEGDNFGFAPVVNVTYPYAGYTYTIGFNQSAGGRCASLYYSPAVDFLATLVELYFMCEESIRGSKRLP